MESVTIDKLAAWLNALGRTFEIRVRPYDRKAKAGQLVIAHELSQGDAAMSRKNELRTGFLKEPAYRREYEALEDKFALAAAPVNARAEAGEPEGPG